MPVETGRAWDVREFPEKQTQRDQGGKDAGERIQQDRDHWRDARQLCDPDLHHTAEADPCKGREEENR